MDNPDINIMPARALWVDALMVSLALVSVFFLIAEVAIEQTPQNKLVIQYADIIIAFIFLADFLYSFAHAAHKKLFFKKRWWELLAAIPITSHTTQALRILKLERIVAIVESLQIVRLAVRVKMLADASWRFAHEIYIFYVVTVVAIILNVSALGFFYFEYPANPAVHSFWDSLWWAISTMTTTGYGDIYPITTGGRIVAIMVMLMGLSVLGALVALIDSYVIKAYLFRRTYIIKR